jgi:hypothetical protein
MLMRRSPASAEAASGGARRLLARVRRSALHADLLPWAMLIKAPLTAFLTALAAKAASDAWDALKAFVAKVYAERRRPGRNDGAIQFEDERRTVILTDRLPDEAYQLLRLGRGERLVAYLLSARRSVSRSPLLAPALIAGDHLVDLAVEA